MNTVSWMMSGGMRDDSATDLRSFQQQAALRDADALQRLAGVMPIDVRDLVARLVERIAPAAPATLDRCCAA